MDDHELEMLNLSDEPCPIDGRRSARTLYLKLFIISFTTIASYFRLLKIRDRNILSLSPLIFWLAPLNYVFSYILVLLFIFATFGFRVLLRRLNAKTWGRDNIGLFQFLAELDGNEHPLTMLKVRLRCLLGKMPSRARSFELNTKQPAQSSLEKFARALGGLLMTCFFMAQCLGSIILWHRRKDRKAVATLDQRTFELACGGLLIGILTLCHTLGLPIFNGPISNRNIFLLQGGDVYQAPPVDGLTLFLRDSYLQVDINDRADEEIAYQLLPRLLKHLALARLISSFFNYHPSTADNFHRGDLRLIFSNEPGLSTIYKCFAISVGLFIAFCFCWWALAEIRASPPNFEYLKRRYGRLMPIICLVTCLLGVLVGLLAGYVCIEGGLMILTLFHWILQCLQDIGLGPLDALKLHPIDTACPELVWSDPWSDLILNLA
ncbi:hypothetical protein QBC40DRAFT_333857 [Triangularia verruculosa]|uniref:Uncharacterized protein n=1 Tax=Triangularia verruculosa TaxID=2587418 RepID=A0AAN7ASX0_9PEZI|nr:hypothetical protein QBC40DRAFT_333857 [Triangularia verruculosa]